jgi:hypothetical protein
MSGCADIEDYISALDQQIARCYGVLFETAAEGVDQLETEETAESIAEAACSALGLGFVPCQVVGEAVKQLLREKQKALRDRARDAADGASKAEEAKEELEGLLACCDALPSGPQNDDERERLAREAYMIAGPGLEGTCGGDDWSDDDSEEEETKDLLEELLERVKDLDLPDFG